MSISITACKRCGTIYACIVCECPSCHASDDRGVCFELVDSYDEITEDYDNCSVLRCNDRTNDLRSGPC